MFTTLAALACFVTQPARQTINLDDNWKFSLGHASDPDKDFGYGATSFGTFAKAGIEDGAMGRGFGDAAWRTVHLPHDWAVELPFAEKGDLMHGFKAIGRRFPENSIGWYRKHFDIAKENAGKRFVLQFDGIFRDAQVWVNGQYATRNDSGYVGFRVDVTKMLEPGQRNTIAIRVNASEYEGWFYEGAGIYRHVWLHQTDPTYLVEDEQFVRATVDKKGNATVITSLNAMVTKSVTAEVQLFDIKGNAVAKSSSSTLKPAADAVIRDIKFSVSKPKLWSPEEPNLYTAMITLKDGDQVVDYYQTKVGFRTYSWDADKGFFVNGKHTLIKGVCNHQDHAGVGVAIPDQLNRWRLERLKEMGCNALRTSHNPPTPELLDACDELGILVFDETRLFSAGPEGISQMERFVKRDRNHPSIFMWSIGNEEWGVQSSPAGRQIAEALQGVVRKLDPTRPTSFGGNNGADYQGVNEVVDIRGFNYNVWAIDQYHKAHPKQPVHGSETSSMLSTRGEYKSNNGKNVMDSYDYKKVDWGNGAEEWWKHAMARPFFAGGFVWTGFDYRGEPTPHSWPTISSHFGILDTCGFPKDVFYYYQAWWSDKPVLHILPHWNWKGQEGKEISVWVYSNLAEVELSLNGRSLGSQKMPTNGHVEWKVPYEAGQLVARGKKADGSVMTSQVETTGGTSNLKFEASAESIKPGARESVVLNVSGHDANGRLNPDGAEKVSFEIEGPGRIIGVGNGDPNCHEPDQFFAQALWRDLTSNWEWKQVKEFGNVLDGSGKWVGVNVFNSQDMAPNTKAIFRTSFEVADPSVWNTLNLGAIDDEGSIYLNGELIRKTSVWNEVYSLDVTGKLRAGKNEIVIAVQNNGGSGGFSKGASIGGNAPAVAWSRSLFHGRAQLIIESTGKPGTIMVRAKSGSIETTSTIRVKS